ncbi:MAG: Hin recombinase, partial [Bacteroidetes bacterium]|nr:Hin recombinase [Bacteroidota bacterium]
KGGRPRAMDNRKIIMAKTLHQDNNNSIADICETLGIKKTTLYKYLKLA